MRANNFIFIWLFLSLFSHASPLGRARLDSENAKDWGLEIEYYDRGENQHSVFTLTLDLEKNKERIKRYGTPKLLVYSFIDKERKQYSNITVSAFSEDAGKGKKKLTWYLDPRFFDYVSPSIHFGPENFVAYIDIKSFHSKKGSAKK